MIIYMTAPFEDGNFDFEYLYLKYKNMVWAQINNSTVTDESLKEEIMQDVFVKLYGTLGKFQNEQAIKRWIRLVTRSTVIDSNKKDSTYKKHINIVLDDDAVFDECADIFENTPLNELVKKEAAKELMDELRALKPIHSEVIILHYYMGFSVKEIAERLRLSENTVYSRLSRARSILYEAVSKSVREYFLGGGESGEK